MSFQCKRAIFHGNGKSFAFKNRRLEDMMLTGIMNIRDLRAAGRGIKRSGR